MDLTVESIMTKTLITCYPTDSIMSALNIMRQRGYSQLPVITHDGKTVGTITESDVNDMLIKGASIESLKNLLVRKVMGSTLPQVDKSSPVSMIYPMLKYSSAVLVTDGGELRGIVSKADILKAVEEYA